MIFTVSILEFAFPVWNNAITKEEISDIERVQKTFLQIALGKDYIGYREALNKTEMETLEVRRTQLCKKFAIKAAKHPKHKDWFSVSQAKPNTRSAKTTYKEPLCRLNRYEESPIPYLTSLLNVS